MSAPKGFVGKLQQTMKRNLGFTIPLFYGKGIWMAKGLLPYQNPVHVVVGRPIDLPQVDEPSQVGFDEHRPQERLTAVVEQGCVHARSSGCRPVGYISAEANSIPSQWPHPAPFADKNTCSSTGANRPVP
jgi:hypothetical protein